MPLAVGIRCDERPRSEVGVTRVYLDVLRKGVCTPVNVTKLAVTTAPRMGVIKCKDEINIIVDRSYTIVCTRVESSNTI